MLKSIVNSLVNFVIYILCRLFLLKTLYYKFYIIMDVIEIDGKTYDPYFILDVTREDSSSHIVKSFREKVKKYHPDKYTDPKKKEKYEKYFKILNESYRYIKDKRESVSKIRRLDDKNQNSKNQNSKNRKQVKLDKTFKEQSDLDDFNKSFKQSDSVKQTDLEEQDQNYERLQRKEDYDNIDVKVYNQFEERKFKLDEFNKMFEYTKGEENDISKKSLVHKTTDGFYGYNTSDTFALVSSFNGLMIVGDNLYQNGYWGSGYSDYKHSYKMSKNPNSKIIIPKDKINKTDKILKNPIKNIDRKDREIPPASGTFSQQENTLNKKIYDDLLKKELEDEAIVKQYISQYNESIVKKALSGELDQDIKLTSVLRRYITN
jgi:curved DNA-binding protein CbpA